MKNSLSPEEFAAMQGRLEELMPALQDEAGQFVDLNLTMLREESCLRFETEEEQTQTRWISEVAGPVADPQSAHAALDAVGTRLKADGWTLIAEESHPAETNGMARELYFEKDRLGITARYEPGELVGDTIVLFARTHCTDHPEDHEMLRSPLESGNGNRSQR